MLTTQELLERFARQHNLQSDYAVAKRLGIDRQRMSSYKRQGVTLGPEIAIAIADTLNLDRGYVLACMAAERAKRSDEKRAWESLAKKAATAAMLLILVGLVSVTDINAASASEITSAFHLYTLCAIGLPWLLRVALKAIKGYRTRPRPCKIADAVYAF